MIFVISVVFVLNFNHTNNKICFSRNRCSQIQIRRGQKKVPRVTLPSNVYSDLTPLRRTVSAWFPDRSFPVNGASIVSTTFICLQIMKPKQTKYIICCKYITTIASQKVCGAPQTHCEVVVVVLRYT